MFTLPAFILWLHLALGVIWIGGLFFLAFIIMPVIKNGGSAAGESGREFGNAVRRFQRISREVILFIVLTGIFNLIHTGLLIDFNFSARFILIITIKVVLIAIIIVIQLVTAFKYLPEFEALRSPRPNSDSQQNAAAFRLQRKITVLWRFGLIMGLGVIFLGLSLRYA